MYKNTLNLFILYGVYNMEKNNNKRKRKSKSLLGLFEIALIIVTISMFMAHSIYEKKIITLEVNKNGLAHVELINSGIQKVTKLELENNSEHELIESIEFYVMELNSEELNFFRESKTNKESITVVVEGWEEFKSVVYKYRETNNKSDMFSISEKLYKTLSKIISEIIYYNNDYNEKVYSSQKHLMVTIVLLAILLLRIILNTVKELEKNKEMSENIYIDQQTGVYNRRKCNQILIEPINVLNLKPVGRAMIVIDLNNMRKNNDTLGYRLGDELILTFATQLRKVCEVFEYDIFVGRCGGDEFMVYFECTVVEDIEFFIEELDYLIDKFNNKSNRKFDLSYASGYSITEEETKNIQMQELFNIADKNMRKNKSIIKEKIKQELLEQGVYLVDFKKRER